MRGRFFRIISTAVMVGAMLSGCAQMTRHSNTLVFGTNTSFGIKVGTDAASTPGVTVGYSRQEAVVMPVVANTADNGNVQAPCPVGTGGVGGAIAEVCLLRASDGGKKDAYSVLASFGTKYAAGGGTPNANGQIVQYFATGIAAQKLAENGGAAAIALGGAATASALRLHGPADDVDRLLHPTPEQLAGDAAVQTQIIADRGKVSAAISANQQDWKQLLVRLDQSAGTNGAFQRACTAAADAAACADIVVNARNGLVGLAPDQWARAAATN
ncbi:hypothetical protein [Sandarakinorhabdus limnophila]|uniref:hypothetical protein n=1 Tax=Sandarakinorhabdus limnophila TaxID=210512 RepID=UPI0026EB6C28|nr:hypothetical protein [Sandarakinorhabdus limnophila]MCM0031888.1 hypothetical protein [Sandarakinorhabdus limnophila]